MILQELLTAAWLRTNLPAAWRAGFERNYREAQEYIEAHTTIDPRPWPGPA